MRTVFITEKKIKFRSHHPKIDKLVMVKPKLL